MGISSITFAIGCPIYGWIIQRVNRRLVIFICLIVSAFVNNMIGDRKYTGIENGLI